MSIRCFTCGVVDGDHEARNCPVSLICSACGSRGHFSRVGCAHILIPLTNTETCIDRQDCHDSTAGRSAFGSRCATCSSSNHGTAVRLLFVDPLFFSLADILIHRIRIALPFGESTIRPVRNQRKRKSFLPVQTRASRLIISLMTGASLSRLSCRSYA